MLDYYFVTPRICIELNKIQGEKKERKKKKEKKGSPDEIKRNAGLKIFKGQIMKQRVEACPRIVFPVSFVCAIIVRPFVLFSFFHDGLFP